MVSNSNSKLYLLPLSIFILFPLTFATTYTIAVSNGHIKPFFSYISDTGTLTPEMNIFGQLLNFLGVLLGLTVFVRYNQISEYFKANADDKIKKYNKIGLVFGYIAAVGTSVVGNFQESNMIIMHVVGAWMAFGGGSIFLIIQAWFSFKLVPMFGTKALSALRMAIGIACLCLFLTSFTTGATSVKYFTGEKALLWEPEDGGWALHVTSTVTEWVMAALFDLYFLTLVPEFKKISYDAPKFTLVNMVGGRRQNGNTSAPSEKVVMQRIGTDEA